MKTLESSTAVAGGQARRFELLDVERLDRHKPTGAVKRLQVKSKPKPISTQLLIVGGGMGGVAAALTACSAGIPVCITEQTSWLGGQMTSQGVSALDENFFVETTGATRMYKSFRQMIRKHYRQLGAANGGARFSPYLDPGNCWVSRLAFEPKVAVRILSEILNEHIQSGMLKVYLRTAPFMVRKSKNKITAVQCVDFDSGEIREFRCRFCIDATELGDLLPLSDIPYNSGAESRKLTGEPHAPETGNQDNVQDFTYPFVVEFRRGENHVIEKPPHFDDFKASGKFSLFGYRMFENSTIINENGGQMEFLPFWEYRRLIDKSIFPVNCFANDLAMINWDSNDLRNENVIDKSAATAAERLALAKNLSLGFLYWLQTEALRDDSGKGYPELKLRTDILGTTDGLSMYTNIRESRRIKAKYTIVEDDIVQSSNSGSRAKTFSDTLGIGWYPVDIHGKQDVAGAGQATAPFQFPASAFVQSKIRNLLPACKNIGTTHVSNGAYRLHPIEWAIGEAAGSFAVEVLNRKTDVCRLLKNKRALRSVQQRLLANGAPLFWFDDVLPEQDDFEAIQFVTVCELMPWDDNNLHFRPEDLITRGELAISLSRLLRLSPPQDLSFAINDLPMDDPRYLPAMSCVAFGLMKLFGERTFSADSNVKGTELQDLAKHKLISYKGSNAAKDVVSRSDFAKWLYELCKEKRFFGRH